MSERHITVNIWPQLMFTWLIKDSHVAVRNFFHPGQWWSCLSTLNERRFIWPSGGLFGSSCSVTCYFLSFFDLGRSSQFSKQYYGSTTAVVRQYYGSTIRQCLLLIKNRKIKISKKSLSAAKVFQLKKSAYHIRRDLCDIVAFLWLLLQNIKIIFSIL